MSKDEDVVSNALYDLGCACVIEGDQELCEPHKSLTNILDERDDFERVADLREAEVMLLRAERNETVAALARIRDLGFKPGAHIENAVAIARDALVRLSTPKADIDEHELGTDAAERAAARIRLAEAERDEAYRQRDDNWRRLCEANDRTDEAVAALRQIARDKDFQGFTASARVAQRRLERIARLSTPKEPERCPTCGSGNPKLWWGMDPDPCPDPWHQSPEGSER